MKQGSDHCPVYAVIKNQIGCDGQEVCILDQVNPPGMFEDGVRLREYCVKDMLPLSGKLIPEFNGRRSIRDMFSIKPKQNSQGPSSQIVSLDKKNNSNLALIGAEHTATQHLENLSSTPSLNSSQASPKSKLKSNATATGVKRQAPGKAAPATVKRSKSSFSSAPAANRSTAQQSLKGFFRPTNSNSHVIVDLTEEIQNDLPDTEAACSDETEKFSHRRAVEAEMDKPFEGIEVDALFSDGLECGTSLRLSKDGSQAEVHDPVQSKESWSKLFAKPVAPCCEGHNEPCKTMVTKKPGVNCGRSFWICAKPLGPSGNKEKGTEWRCGTFIWCSDWNSSAPRSGTAE